MKYVIFELCKNNTREPDGYEIKTITKYTLEKLDVVGVENTHSTLDSALLEIEKNKDLLKHKSLTVIPLIEIDWAGEIKTPNIW